MEWGRIDAYKPCRPAGRPACLPARLPACLPAACLRACLPAWAVRAYRERLGHPPPSNPQTLHWSSLPLPQTLVNSPHQKGAEGSASPKTSSPAGLTALQPLTLSLRYSHLPRCPPPRLPPPGKPKGVVHTTGGYMLGSYLTFRHVFDYQADDVYWCTADCGWITGHSYVTFGEP